jgi:hypothetical protein
VVKVEKGWQIGVGLLNQNTNQLEWQEFQLPQWETYLTRPEQLMKLIPFAAGKGHQVEMASVEEFKVVKRLWERYLSKIENS